MFLASQSLLVFAVVTVILYLVLGVAVRHKSALGERLASLKNESSRSGRLGEDGARPIQVFVSNQSHPKRDAAAKEGSNRRIQTMLVQAGIYHISALPMFVIVKYALLIASPLIGGLAGYYRYLAFGHGLIIGAGIGGLGMLLPDWWLQNQVKRRHTILRRSLPDFLDLLIVCVEGGLSIQAAIQRVSEELRVAHPILAGEFLVVQRDIELGSSVETALRRFAERTGFEGLRTLATFIRESQRFGSELGAALREHADMMRIQRELIAEESAQKASVKVLFPMLLFILPAVFVVLVGPAAMQIYEVFSK